MSYSCGPMVVFILLYRLGSLYWRVVVMPPSSSMLGGLSSGFSGPLVSYRVISYGFSQISTPLNVRSGRFSSRSHSSMGRMRGW